MKNKNMLLGILGMVMLLLIVVSVSAYNSALPWCTETWHNSQNGGCGPFMGANCGGYEAYQIYGSEGFNCVRVGWFGQCAGNGAYCNSKCEDIGCEESKQCITSGNDIHKCLNKCDATLGRCASYRHMSPPTLI